MSTQKHNNTKSSHATMNKKEIQKGGGVAMAGKKRGFDARSESHKKTSADVFARHTYKHIPNKKDDGITYMVELSKSSRSKCRQSGELIPKGTLRWASHRRGIPINGYVSLRNATPEMIRKAIKVIYDQHSGNVSEVVLDIKGLEDLSPEKETEALATLREIAKAGNESLNEEGGLILLMAATLLDNKMKEKPLLLDIPKDAINNKTYDSNKDDSSWIIVKADDDLSASGADKEIATEMDDENSGECYASNINTNGDEDIYSGTGSDTCNDKHSLPKAKSLFSFSTISALTSGYCQRQEKEEADKNNKMDDVEYGDQTPPLSRETCVHQSRLPATKDVIIIQNLCNTKRGRGEALCLVESSALSTKNNNNEAFVANVTVSACMEEFPGQKSIVLSNDGSYLENTVEDVCGDTADVDEKHNKKWRFMPSRGLKMSQRCYFDMSDENKHHHYPPTQHSIKEVQKMGAAEVPTTQKPLEGLRFVATGVTEEYCTTEMFKAYIRGIVEAAGGRMTLKISGKTDYVVAGDWHFDPFKNVVGTIESGSKYQKAMVTENCIIISLDDLRNMVELGVGEFRNSIMGEDERESGF